MHNFLIVFYDIYIPKLTGFLYKLVYWQNLIKMLFLEKRNSSDAEEDAIKYIIVVPETSVIEGCLKNIPQAALDNKQIMFATVDYDYETGKPNIQYYKV